MENNIIRVRKAVIPVAGLGTRVLPASKAIPKEMIPVVDKPVIQWVVEEAVRAGIKEIVLVTRGGKSSIENHFDTHYELEAELTRKNKSTLLATIKNIVPPDVSIVSIRQPEAKGLGHAVFCAQGIIGHEPFVVILPDVLVNNSAKGSNDLERMINTFESNQAAQIMVGEVPIEKISQYGVVDCNGIDVKGGESTETIRMVEKPAKDKAPSNLAVIGRYVLPARVMELLAEGKPGAGGEIQLTDALDALLQEQTVEAYKMLGDTYDCGEKLGLLKANIVYGLQHAETAGGLHEFFAGHVR